MEEMQPAVKAVEECVDILANRLYRAGKGGGMDRILLYFMLTGNMPFRAETVPQLKEKIDDGWKDWFFYIIPSLKAEGLEV